MSTTLIWGFSVYMDINMSVNTYFGLSSDTEN